MNNVQRISPEVRDIHVPAPLRDVPLWLVWAYEQHPGESKPRKVPQYSGGGRRHGAQGSPADVGKLTTFAVARDAAARRGLDGVGFAPLDGWGVIALDFDNCVRDGAVDPVVLDLVRGTYAELSPSGNGVRAIYSGDGQAVGNRKSHGTPFGIEAFSSNGFVTVTGNMLDHVDLLGLQDTVAPLPPRVVDYCATRFATSSAPTDPDDFMAGYEPRLGLTVEQMETLLNALDPDMSREEWIKVGMALHHECEGDDTGFEIWNDWSSTGGKYPSEEALREQWDSFERRKAAGRKQVTMASVIRRAKEAGLQWPLIQTTQSVIEKADAILGGLEASVGAHTPEGFTGKFKAQSALEATQAKPTGWLIKDVLPAADLIVLFGASGAGKSFVALDMGIHISRGLPWRGKRCKPGRVVYIAAEGGGGVGKRIKAYCDYHGIDPATLDLAVITAAPNFLDNEDITEVVATLRAVGEVSLVIVDTFAQVTPGANENGAEDMGRALANARTLCEASGATNMLVHHAGKDLARGARGWSGIKAAADAQIEVLRHDNGREIVIDKLKDGEDGIRWGFKLERVLLGLDEDGDEITSCVAVEAELPRAEEPERKGIKRRGRIENHVLEIIATMGPSDTVSVEELVKQAAEAMPSPEAGTRDTRRQVVTRAIHNMAKEKDGPLSLAGGTVIFYA